MKKDYNDKKYYRALLPQIAVLAVVLFLAGVLSKNEGITLYVVAALAIATSVFYNFVITGVLLRRRFDRLGTIKGMTVEKIVHAVGESDCKTVMDDGTEILEWTMTSHKVTLGFRDNTCVKEDRTNSFS